MKKKLLAFLLIGATLTSCGKKEVDNEDLLEMNPPQETEVEEQIIEDKIVDKEDKDPVVMAGDKEIEYPFTKETEFPETVEVEAEDEFIRNVTIRDNSITVLGVTVGDKEEDAEEKLASLEDEYPLESTEQFTQVHLPESLIRVVYGDGVVKGIEIKSLEERIEDDN